ncbi:MAG: hypothetical protein BroJett006_31030 [Betaproteobacteria bacterium]|nr:MAG: hypothetical protein BroJett006_31030 [Betaproteobacteria bacterium]
MKTFTDNAGRTWTLAINVDVLKRVRGLVDVNLLDIIDGKLIERLYRDPVLLCDVVYAVCKPEADARNVSDEDFGRAMAGDAIEQATKALLEELVLFSPSPRDRANLQRVLETTWRVMDKARDLVEARLATVDAEQIVAQALVTSGTSSGSAPESPASTPDG